MIEKKRKETVPNHPDEIKIIYSLYKDKTDHDSFSHTPSGSDALIRVYPWYWFLMHACTHTHTHTHTHTPIHQTPLVKHLRYTQNTLWAERGRETQISLINTIHTLNKSYN